MGGSTCEGGNWPVNRVTWELLVHPASEQALNINLWGVNTPTPGQSKENIIITPENYETVKKDYKKQTNNLPQKTIILF